MSGFLESVGNVCKGTLVVLCTPVLIPHAVYRNKCARRVPFAAEIEDEAMDEGVRRKRQSNLTTGGTKPCVLSYALYRGEKSYGSGGENCWKECRYEKLLSGKRAFVHTYE